MGILKKIVFVFQDVLLQGQAMDIIWIEYGKMEYCVFVSSYQALAKLSDLGLFTGTNPNKCW
jgi:hypothetical protein